ncbi:MAG: FAD:protein FMN transferase [Rhodothermales bacterium]
MRFNSLVVVFLCLCFGSCTPEPIVLTSFDGQTMGTTYRVSVVTAFSRTAALKASTDQLLEEVNASLSTYIDSSLISTINASDDTNTFHVVDPHFSAVFKKALEIHELTDGFFNPAVGPLVAAWGFGPKKEAQPSAAEVDSLLRLTNLDAFYWQSSNTIGKRLAHGQLDFNAIAKGYGVDVVAELLIEEGINDFFVEIGGEVRTKGQHLEGRLWRAGIDKPTIDEPTVDINQAREIQAAIEIENMGLATSGNYRNFYVQEGRKYVHTISPFTGYPKESDLLSASVLANDCMTADAYATAFMVMGKEKALRLAEQQDGIEAYFVIADSSGNYNEVSTSGFPPSLIAND